MAFLNSSILQVLSIYSVRFVGDKEETELSILQGPITLWESRTQKRISGWGIRVPGWISDVCSGHGMWKWCLPSLLHGIRRFKQSVCFLHSVKSGGKTSLPLCFMWFNSTDFCWLLSVCQAFIFNFFKFLWHAHLAIMNVTLASVESCFLEGFNLHVFF